jgi:DNA repair protein RadD
VGASGDYTQNGLVEAQRKSTITGDCVASYLRFTPNEQAVVFAVDVEHATELAMAYREAGVSAEVVSAKTPAVVRKSLMDKFERGVFKVLCNVDLFGEGLNVLGISVVVMARPTQSFVLFTQQFFRALTAADGKHRGTIIDHAGNVGFFGKTYGLPDAYNAWSLYAEERGKRGAVDPDVLPVTTCVACFSAFEAITRTCPFCGHTPEPVGRNRPEFVDGDLLELDPATLAAMRGEIERIDGPALVPGHLDAIATRALQNRWRDRQDAQTDLRHAIAVWAGVWRDKGAQDSEIYRRFFFRFGTDIGTAQTLNRADAEQLRERIEGTWTTDA